MSADTPYIFFWRTESPFSQWHRSQFTIEGQTFGCAEQYMMYAKATLFGDAGAAQAILRSDSPREHKALGRKVRGFDHAVWEREREGVVYRGNHAKFTQNRGLLKKLLATGQSQLVEASPTDCIWGVGLAEEDPLIHDPANWRGLNLLGKVLTRLRDELRAEYALAGDE